MAIAAAQKANLMEAFPIHEIRQWQLNAIEVLFYQNDRDVTWVFDINGNTGKPHLRQFLVHIMGYQHI